MRLERIDLRHAVRGLSAALDLAEPRSYRPALPRGEILMALREMATRRKLDPFVLQVFEQNLDVLDRVRLDAIAHSEREFARLRAAAAEIQAFAPASDGRTCASPCRAEGARSPPVGERGAPTGWSRGGAAW